MTIAAPLATLLALALPQEGSRAPLLDDRQVQVEMNRIAAAHQGLASVIAVGELPTRGGRKIEALRLAAGERAAGRPAILLVAGLEGERAWTSGLALDHAERLAAGYATDARIKAFLDSTTLYVIPRANPDAAQARFEKPLAESPATGAGVDDDRDGRQGEDPPSDVDGDGIVAWMRVPDPDGEWMADPADPRATIRADPKKGQRGLWKLVREGRDSDRDERASEDAERDAVVNRNFPDGWEEHAPRAGLFATDEPEARDLCRFVLDHRDVAFVLVYGELDDFAPKPKTVKDDAPRVKGIPPAGMPESDAAILEELGRRRAKLVAKPVEGETDGAGTFQAWCRYHRGLWTASVSPWSIPTDAKGPEKTPEGGEKPAEKKDEPEPSDDAKRLRWVDEKGETARFLPWKEHAHPELGEVEIGGWAPYAKAEPPEAERDAIAQAELEFLLGLGDVLPRVRATECAARDLGGGVWEIEAAIENDALLPLQGVAGKRSGAPRPARVSIAIPSGARLVAGKRETLVDDLPGSVGRRELRWLVVGAPPSAIAVEVDTDNAGTVRVTPEVKR